MKFLTNLTAASVATVLPLQAIADVCTNDVWNRVMERGVLVAGVKADYKPWGFRESDGEIVGMEPDLVASVAEVMGVDYELVPVVGSNRLAFLEQGQIDMFIATMTDRQDRREIVGIPSPNYYSSGTNIMSPRALGYTSWEQLAGQPVCAIQGAFFNRLVEDRYDVNIVAFQGTAEAKQALRDKRCVAFLFDDSGLMSTLASGDWEEFEMPLPTEDASSWGVAVPKPEENCLWGRFMSGMIYNWHRDGTLIELEAKWGIQPTAYLADQAEIFADHLIAE